MVWVKGARILLVAAGSVGFRRGSGEREVRPCDREDGIGRWTSPRRLLSRVGPSTMPPDLERRQHQNRGERRDQESAGNDCPATGRRRKVPTTDPAAMTRRNDRFRPSTAKAPVLAVSGEPDQHGGQAHRKGQRSGQLDIGAEDQHQRRGSAIPHRPRPSARPRRRSRIPARHRRPFGPRRSWAARTRSRHDRTEGRRRMPTIRTASTLLKRLGFQARRPTGADPCAQADCRPEG